jgi:hypothetical protein
LYTRWLLRRIEAGFCDWIHPFGGGLRRVSLRPEDCLAIVFWTRNPAPLLPALEDIRSAGYFFYFHFTLTGYPRLLESHGPEWTSAVRGFRELASRVGPAAVIWRYDPIVLSSLTPEPFHLDRFARIAAALEGATHQVYFSFVDLYGKTRGNFSRLGRDHGVSFEEPSGQVKKHLALRLRDIARRHHMTLHACCEDALLGDGIEKGRCVDIDKVRMLRPDLPETPGRRPTRKECGCTGSVDLGAYDTCPYGCRYCYATRSREAALARLREHDPQDTLIWRPPALRAAGGAARSQ